MIVELLPERLRPAAKAIVAALIPLIAAAVNGLITGVWDKATLALAIVGVITALLVYRTPNKDA